MSKKEKKQRVPGTVKSAKKQRVNKSISFETFQKRGGFYRNKEELLEAFLKSHLKNGDVHSYGEGEAGFARLIDSRKLFYKKTGNRYTLLNVSTIATYLRKVKSKVLTEIAEERAEERRRKEEKIRGK